MILPGKYKAKVADYGVTVAQSGNPQVAITFTVFTTEDTSIGTSLQWWGSFHAGAKKFTLEALDVCGLRSPNHLGLLPKGKSSGALDCDRFVNVTIEHREGKKFPEIRWIGPVTNKNALDENDFEAFLAQGSLKADFAEIIHNKGANLNDETYDERSPPPVSAEAGGDPFAGIQF